MSPKVTPKVFGELAAAVAQMATDEYPQHQMVATCRQLFRPDQIDDDDITDTVESLLDAWNRLQIYPPDMLPSSLPTFEELMQEPPPATFQGMTELPDPDPRNGKVNPDGTVDLWLPETP